MKTFADAELVLADKLPGYAPRPQQQKLATAVEQLFFDMEVRQLLAQAGCGVGKSLASLIPAILSGERVIYATATKALQEQIAGKDVPFLQENLGVDFSFALLKGRSNYVCVSKMAEVTTAQLPNIERIREELADFDDHSGDFEHLANSVPEDRKYLLSMSSAECPGKSECPLAASCFAEKAKEIAKDAQVVVTNTAMLMTDLKLQEVSEGNVQMLGDYSAVIIDEAHELPEIAAGAMADQLRRRGIENVISGAVGFVGEHSGDTPATQVEKAAGAIESIFSHLEELAEGEQVELKMSELASNFESYVELVEVLRALYDIVHDTQVRVGNPTKESARQRRLLRRLVSMEARLTEFLTSTEIVRWIETETNRRREQITTLKWSPVDVGPFLTRNLWEKVPVALVSATLAVGEDFSYIAETLGLQTPETLDVGTPFDYETQARLFVPGKDAPVPSGRTRPAWSVYAQAATRELIAAAGGGALLLYTSRREMQAAYEALAPVLEQAGHTVLMQGRHGTNKEIARVFSEDTHSVLFALKSFFTGVDFSGETCRLVVIDKLPFPVPSDIMFNARANLINKRAGADVSFKKLSIPMMTLPLVQGFGRLIRSTADRGVVAILDPRLVSKGYGKGILKALPPAPMTHNLKDVAGFYAA